MSKYRKATSQEIADCIRRQVVDACDLATTDEYKSKPTKLLALICDIKVCAKSNADWLASQNLDRIGNSQHATHNGVSGMIVKHQIDGPTVTTTDGLIFAYAEHCLMAALVFKRFGHDKEAATAAWSRMMENNSSVDEFLELANRGGMVLRTVHNHWS